MLFRRILNLIFMLFLSNALVILSALKLGAMQSTVLTGLLVVTFIAFNINPRIKREKTIRLKIMIGGCDLLAAAVSTFAAEAVLYIYICLFSKISFAPQMLVFNALLGAAAILLLTWNGLIRIAATSTQLGILFRVLLLTLWWVPVVNLVLFWKCCGTVRREYLFETAKIELNNTRKACETCKTKYPILLVHGIFWRDWQLFNYWGRIPGELIKNGATIYYGNQQSAAAMEVGANELKNQINRIIAESNCEKINIIAHSKGGLDARYMISRLGMAQSVSSLTTICAPHRGCSFVDQLIKIVPEKLVRVISRRYNALYKKLGDTHPDFYSGLSDLTAKKCAVFNAEVPDKENVFYQSVASKMRGVFSAGFPLNIGYAFLIRSEGENDGFVSVESSKWGDYLGCYATKRKRGVSHGDMIDLMRENIRGFDVCECYVDIVKGLKAKGL